MYRMSRVLETPSVAIVKIAGQITDSDLSGWADFVREMDCESGRWIVLDFCDVCRVDRKAAALLVETLPKHVLLLNCPIGIRNMADSAGLGSQILEAASGRTPCLRNLSLWSSSLAEGIA